MAYNRTILITGGTTGLGYNAALTIAKQLPNCLIIIASRTDRLSSAETLNNTLRQSNTVFLPLDLSSLSNIRSFAEAWPSHRYPPIQALLLNAALQFPGDLQKTKDGIESTFAIAHVGHALLFHLLFPYLAPESRIVITSSGTHDPAQKSGLPDAKYTSGEELAHPSSATMNNSGRQRYATAKLTNIMWMYALHRRLMALSNASMKDEGGEIRSLTAVAFDPGLMPGTGLAREASPFLRWLWKSVMPHIHGLLKLLISPNIHTPQESGENLARLAVGENLKGVSGVYFEGRKEIKSSVESYDEEKQEELWTWTVKFLAKNEEERQKFEIL